jgi:nitroreductase
MTMTVEAAVKRRRSIRKFKSDEIPRVALQEILGTVRWAPSWGNTQPWEFYILTGQPLEEFRDKNRQKTANGEAFSPDITMPEVWPEHMKSRYGGLGKIILEAMDIKRGDKEARNKYYEDMASFFGAPCLMIACVPRNTCVEYAMLDIGLILQTICLLAHDKGIGSCIMAASVVYPKLLREVLSIPEDRLIIMGVALGYPDLDHPINTFERERADMSKFVTWSG